MKELVVNLVVKKAPTVDRDKLIVRINSNDKPDDINWYDYVGLETNWVTKLYASYMVMMFQKLIME
jgi:hypothetical protein